MRPTVLDGTHLVYAVMEPTDAELAEVLRERVLTGDETRQVGLSVVDALRALHAKEMVHGMWRRRMCWLGARR